MLWIRSEHDPSGNRDRILELKALGYRFKVDSYGYQVWFKGEYVEGAGTLGWKWKHWRHHRADANMHLFLAATIAHDHEASDQVDTDLSTDEERGE